MSSVARSISATTRSSEPLWELHQPVTMVRHRSRDALLISIASAVFLTLVGGVLFYKGNTDAMWRLADLDSLLEVRPTSSSPGPQGSHSITSIATAEEDNNLEKPTPIARAEDTEGAVLMAALSNAAMSSTASDASLPPAPTTPAVEETVAPAVAALDSEPSDETGEPAEAAPSGETTPRALPSLTDVTSEESKEETTSAEEFTASLPPVASPKLPEVSDEKAEEVAAAPPPPNLAAEPGLPPPAPIAPPPAVAKVETESMTEVIAVPPPPSIVDGKEVAAEKVADTSADTAKSDVPSRSPAGAEPKPEGPDEVAAAENAQTEKAEFHAHDDMSVQPAKPAALTSVDAEAPHPSPSPTEIKLEEPSHEAAASVPSDRRENVNTETSADVVSQSTIVPPAQVNTEPPLKVESKGAQLQRPPQQAFAALSMPPPEMATASATSAVRQASASMPDRSNADTAANIAPPDDRKTTHVPVKNGFEIAWNNPTGGTSGDRAPSTPPSISMPSVPSGESIPAPTPFPAPTRLPNSPPPDQTPMPPPIANNLGGFQSEIPSTAKPTKVIPSPRSFGSSPYAVAGPEQAGSRTLPGAIEVPVQAAASADAGIPSATPDADMTSQEPQSNGRSISSPQPIARSRSLAETTTLTETSARAPADVASNKPVQPPISSGTAPEVDLATPRRVIATGVPIAQGTVAATLPVTAARKVDGQPVMNARDPIAAAHPNETLPRTPTNAGLAAAPEPVSTVPPATSERFVIVPNMPKERLNAPTYPSTPDTTPARAAAPVSSSLAAAVTTYDVESYIVLDGDSYDSIAKERFRNAGLGPALAHYNRSKLPSNQPLPSGSRILMPPADVIQKESLKLSRAGGGTSNIARSVNNPTPQSVQEIAVRSSAPAAVPNFERLPSTESSRNTMPAASASDPATAAQSNPIFPEVIPAKSAPAPSTLAMPTEPVSTSAGKPAAAPPENEASVYTVEKQETLYAIARRTLGDGRRWREIYDLNTDRLRNEYEVPIGVALRLPEGAMQR